MPRLGGSQSHRHPPGFLRASAAPSGSRHPVLRGGSPAAGATPLLRTDRAGLSAMSGAPRKAGVSLPAPRPPCPEPPEVPPKLRAPSALRPSPADGAYSARRPPLCPLPDPLQAGFSPSAPWLRTHLDVRHLPRGSAAPRCAPRHGTARHGTAPGGEGAATKAPRGWGAPSGRGEPPPRPPHPRLVGKMRGGFVL